MPNEGSGSGLQSTGIFKLASLYQRQNVAPDHMPDSFFMAQTSFYGTYIVLFIPPAGMVYWVHLLCLSVCLSDLGFRKCVLRFEIQLMFFPLHGVI